MCSLGVGLENGSFAHFAGLAFGVAAAFPCEDRVGKPKVRDIFGRVPPPGRISAAPPARTLGHASETNPWIHLCKNRHALQQSICRCLIILRLDVFGLCVHIRKLAISLLPFRKVKCLDSPLYANGIQRVPVKL